MLPIIVPLLFLWAVNHSVKKGGKPYVPDVGPPPPPPPYATPRGGATPAPLPVPPPPPPPPPGPTVIQPVAEFRAPAPSPAAPLPRSDAGVVGTPVMPQAVPGPPPGPPVPVSQLDQAMKLAPTVLADIRAKGFGYDRNALAQFQALTGLGADGKYGGRTAGALVYFTGVQPPTPFYDPKNVIPYLPPGSKKAAPPGPAPVVPTIPAPSVAQLDVAAGLAVKVAQEINAKGKAYDRNLVREFQRAARLGVDGLYGGSSAGAVLYFTGKAPPAPIFPPMQIKPYRPPGL